MDYITDYVTRGGIEIEINLPLNEFGQILASRYLTDSEKRKLKALKLRQELEPIVLIPAYTIH